MHDYEFRVFNPNLLNEVKKITNYKLNKTYLKKLNQQEFHNKIFIKNKIKFVQILSLPFESKIKQLQNFNYLLGYKDKIKIKSDLILPISISKKNFDFQYEFIIKNLNKIDGLEIMLNKQKKNYNEKNIFIFLKKILKKKKLKIIFFPTSSVKIRTLSNSNILISNLIIKINDFDDYKNNFFIALSGGGFDFYLVNGKFSKIFKNVNLIFDTHLYAKFKVFELLHKLGKKRVKFGSDFPFIEKKNINNIYNIYKKFF